MFGRTRRVHDRRLVSLLGQPSCEAEQFRRLRYRLETLASSQGVHVVAITSAVSSDGKTLTAANVAGTLAQAPNARVLLIDADLRRPNVARTLGLDPRPDGLLQLLASGGADLEGHVQRVAGSTLDVLPCEGRRHATYEILTSPAFRTVLDQARQAYDTVIVDTPPVVPVPDSSLLGPLVDGYVVVVAAHVTPRKLLGETLTLLEPASVLGLVFNRDTRPLFGYYGSYYQSYFETAGGTRASG